MTEQEAIWAATVKVRRFLAKTKDKRTLVSGHSPTGVAYHVTAIAVETYLREREHKA